MGIYSFSFGRWKRHAKATIAQAKYQILNPRQPQACDANTASLILLGSDIAILVADLLQETSPKSLSSLALTNQWLHSIARYSQHRTVVLQVPAAQAMKVLCDRLKYLENQKLLSAIRSLEIRHPENLVEETVILIGNYIRRMTGLRDLHCPYSGTSHRLLEVLQLCPSVRLHTTVTNHGKRADEEHNPLSLQRCENLSSLTCTVCYMNGEMCKQMTQPLKQVLLSCPNLRTLNLDIGMPRSGCVIPNPPREYCGFGFVGGERPPALEELVLVDYPFGYEPYTLNSVTFGTGYPCKGGEEDYWAEHFDWTHLRRLTAPTTSFVLKLMPKLTALQEVKFSSYGQDKDDSVRFYQEVPTSLQSICVPNLASVSLEGILRHSKSLRRLQIHQNEDYQGRWRALDGSMDDLRCIRDECHLLEELNIDLARSGDWPWDVLDILATFPRLRHLEIWFELGIVKEDGLVKPYITLEAVSMLFQHLRTRSKIQPSPLQTMRVHSGCPPPIGYGFLAAAAFWPHSQSTEYICMPSERDDEAREGIFIISNRSITAKSSELEYVLKANRRSMAEERKPKPKSKSKSKSGTNQLKLALDGPISLLQWLTESNGGYDW